MKTKIKYIAPVAIVLGMAQSINVFAANPYGIEYSGGTVLGPENVQINRELIENLKPIIQIDSSTASASDALKIQNGYILEGVCTPFKYFTVSNNNLVTSSDNISFSIQQDQFIANIAVNRVVLDGVEDDKVYTVGVANNHSYIYGGWSVFSDATCETPVEGISMPVGGQNGNILVETNAKLYKTTDSQDPFISKGLYFGLTDIDAAQSFKILNSTDLLTRENMFAASAEGLQSQNPAVTLRNMYVSGGNYIYSEYDVTDGSTLGLPDTSNIYVPLSSSAQEQGLNIVFGFASRASSGIEYYLRQFTVTYTSDNNGEINDIEDEKVNIEDNPSGSSTEPNEGFELSYWVADVDITLEDGTVIEAGEKITSEQIKEVVVNQDIEFTAIHETISEEVPVPNTGAFTSENNASQITTSIIGILIGALTVASLPKLLRKKINFR